MKVWQVKRATNASKNAPSPGSEGLESDNLSLLKCNHWLRDEKRYCAAPCSYLFMDAWLCKEHMK